VHGETPAGYAPTQLRQRVRAEAARARAKVPFFFKQWGGINKKKNGRLLQGRVWDMLPA
jgi:protein gp37